MFAPIYGELFLDRTRVHVPPEELTNFYLRTKIWDSARRVLKDFTITLLLMVVNCSWMAQGICCFCPLKFTKGNDYSALNSLGLFTGLIECGWEKKLAIEACRAKFQTFVLEKRGLEHHSTKKDAVVGNALAFLTFQSSLFSIRHHYWVGSVLNSRILCLRPLKNLLCFTSSNSELCFCLCLNKIFRNCPSVWTEFLSIARLESYQLRSLGICEEFTFHSSVSLHSWWL